MLLLAVSDIRQVVIKPGCSKVAGNSGQNPGFEFLQKCWNDDPAIAIAIVKLLVKYPQWRIAIVDGLLVKLLRLGGAAGDAGVAGGE
jgi:hypothetical protein